MPLFTLNTSEKVIALVYNKTSLKEETAGYALALTLPALGAFGVFGARALVAIMSKVDLVWQ
jgi:hypothetical protein